MEVVIKEWLIKAGLEQYILKFEEDGWEKYEDLCDINSKNLKRCISKPGHRRRFKNAFQKYTYKREHARSEDCKTQAHEQPCNALSMVASTHDVDDDKNLCASKIETFEYSKGLFKKAETRPKYRKYEIRDGDEGLHNWLSRICLEQYSPTLIAEGWETIEDLMNMNNEDLERCIPKPGHRKRLQLELQAGTQTLRLKKAPKNKTTSETMVTSIDTFAETDCTPLENITPFEDKNNKENTLSKPRNEHSEHLENTGAENLSNTGDNQRCDAAALHRKLETTATSANTVDVQSAIVPIYDTFEDIACNQQVLEERMTIVLPKTTSCSSSFTTATIMNAEEVTSFDNCTIIQTEAGPSEKYKNQLKCVLNSYQQDDSLFIETKAYQELKDIVESSHWAVIVGIPGDGKSAMAIHLCLQYSKTEYAFVQVHSAQEWKDLIYENNVADSSQKQIMFIDNMFGEMNVDARKVSDWTSVIPYMQRVVKSRAGDLKIVCTTKKCIFVDADLPADKFPFCTGTHVVDLTIDCNALSSEEKNNIWNMYASTYNVTTKKPRCISGKRCTPHGYPLCVVQFFTNGFLQREGVAFFENPMKYICREIENFMKNDRNRYFVLIILLCKTKMLKRDIDEISDDPEKFKDIAKAAGLSSVPTKFEMKSAVDGLKNMYISEKYDGWLNISHDSIRENLASIYIGNTTKHAIENIDFSYLVRHTKWPRWNLMRDKSLHDITSTCQRPFILRILREIKDGNVVGVCRHEAWDSRHFMKKMMKTVLQIDPMEIIDIFKTADTNHPTLKKMTLINSLKYLQHKAAVNCFEKNDELQKILKGKSTTRYFSSSSSKTFELVTDKPTNTLTACRQTQTQKYAVREITNEAKRIHGTATGSEPTSEEHLGQAGSDSAASSNRHTALSNNSVSSKTAAITTTLPSSSTEVKEDSQDDENSNVNKKSVTELIASFNAMAVDSQSIRTMTWPGYEHDSSPRAQWQNSSKNIASTTPQPSSGGSTQCNEFNTWPGPTSEHRTSNMSYKYPKSSVNSQNTQDLRWNPDTFEIPLTQDLNQIQTSIPRNNSACKSLAFVDVKTNLPILSSGQERSASETSESSSAVLSECTNLYTTEDLISPQKIKRVPSSHTAGGQQLLQGCPFPAMNNICIQETRPSQFLHRPQKSVSLPFGMTNTAGDCRKDYNKHVTNNSLAPYPIEARSYLKPSPPFSMIDRDLSQSLSQQHLSRHQSSTSLPVRLSSLSASCETVDVKERDWLPRTEARLSFGDFNNFSTVSNLGPIYPPKYTTFEMKTAYEDASLPNNYILDCKSPVQWPTVQSSDDFHKRSSKAKNQSGPQQISKKIILGQKGVVPPPLSFRRPKDFEKRFSFHDQEDIPLPEPMLQRRKTYPSKCTSNRRGKSGSETNQDLKSRHTSNVTQVHSEVFPKEICPRKIREDLHQKKRKRNKEAEVSFQTKNEIYCDL